MEILFNLSDEKLKTLLDSCFIWCNKSEENKKYQETEKQKSEERKKTWLNKEYLSSLPDEKLVTEILNYSKNLEGPANINIGKPRVLEEIKKIKRNILYIVDSPDDPFEKAEKILENFDEYTGAFVKVMPTEYKRILESIDPAQTESNLSEVSDG